jgi:hypothetical protein
MRSLQFIREPGSDKAYVECASGKVPVHIKCAYCTHCKGITVRARVIPSPFDMASSQIRTGGMPPEALMEAALQFNTLVRDGSAVNCNDDQNNGYASRYRTIR